MMAVEDGGRVHLASPVAVVLKDTAREVVLLVDHMVEVEFVVLSVHDRIVDHGFGAVDPARHIGIFFQELGEVDFDRSGLAFFLSICARFCPFRFRLFLHDLLGSPLVLRASLIVFRKDSIEAVSAVEQDAYEKYKQKIYDEFFHNNTCLPRPGLSASRGPQTALIL